MVKRRYWVNLIENAWRRRSLIWLRGVRRSGKTVLSQSLDNVEYFDCEIPRVRQSMSDPEYFLGKLKGRRVILDEIHRLQNPSELLKIAADHFPSIHVLATGSSSLQASRKFRDTLTGRKSEITLTPMNSLDAEDFPGDLDQRLLRGGLPPFFLNPSTSGLDFQEWMDSYWAKDIQDLYRLERQSSFKKCVELAFVQSGGIFEASAFAGPCEISRTTVWKYLQVLQDTGVCIVLRPFFNRPTREIVAAPKVYGFDTGFTAYYRDWSALNAEEKGVLWEHYVLNEMDSLQGGRSLHYWRDKQGHEVDFVMGGPRGSATAIECKWSARGFDSNGIAGFRKFHPNGENWVVAADVTVPFERREKGMILKFSDIRSLGSLLEGSKKGVRA